MKINIIGTTASGKSTFGRRLAETLTVPFIEMDLIFWGPNWAKPTDEEYFRKIEIATSAPSWVLDGNYTRTTPIKWKNVDLVIWLDYGFCRTFYQSVTRATIRACNRTELWPNTGNYESFGRMFSRDSIIWWCVKNYSKNRARYKEVMRNLDYSHIKFVHLKTPGQAEQYLESCSQRLKNGYNKAL